MSQQDSPAKKLLRDRGIMIWSIPSGYVIMVNNRGGSIRFRIEGDEMDAILSLGRIKQLEVLTNEIRIEVVNTLT